MSFNPSAGFSSLNAVNAAKGMAGTSRAGTATFAGGPGASATASMPGGQAPVAAAPVGSSYTKGAGMQMSGGGAMQNSIATLGDQSGVIAGQSMPMANVGQQAPQMTAAEMQDPANAALAGYAFSQTQDAPVQASQQPAQPGNAGPSTPAAAHTSYTANAAAPVALGLNRSLGAPAAPGTAGNQASLDAARRVQ